MLIVRYNVFFPETEFNYFELALSLTTLDAYVGPYIPMRVIIYTLERFKPYLTRLCSSFRFEHRVVALDRDHPDLYARNTEFAATIKNCLPVDRICINRMLCDFELLPADTHRLLIGTDIFFLDVPQEVLAFVWSEDPKEKVLYAFDNTTFGGVKYKLTHYRPPILEGLLGDFYCLAPGVRLRRDSIIGCLRMIDAWPTTPNRYQPPFLDVVNACEQQATAILLQQFGGITLPQERYSHWHYTPSVAVLHTHDVSKAVTNSKPEVIERYLSLPHVRERLVPQEARTGNPPRG